ncbi:hypothetical protein [Thermus tengchongensis]|uniref:HEPN domain-containing protein n=1 Tax=Thermus tengchongensis TaxID=1214928 RepID=A0A4Y9F8Z6_9DEIN|nr:hypothetical protein [Thermus tengchongensis]TFU24973.1 hypothetical protein E0687_13075 [Thermus tengchongensis]
MTEAEARRVRAGEDLALAFALSEKSPRWAAVVLFYAVHHALLAWALERLPQAPIPQSYAQAQSLLKRAGLPRQVRKAYERLLGLSWQARYDPRAEGKALWTTAQREYAQVEAFLLDA